jgi:hypothetical protein
MRPAALAPLLAVLVAASGGSARAHGDLVNPYPGYVSATYADPAHWLCRPDTADVCDGGQDATVVTAKGRTRVERWRPAPAPKIDCFYVYPTISIDPGANSDLVPGPTEELFVVQQQAARLGSVCRVFAPVYRQITLTALLGAIAGGPLGGDGALADADLLDAWKHYVANDNGGRGVVLIGHSQGAGRLVTLIRNAIDGEDALRDRLVSAILLGTSLQVPDGADVGGDFQHVPLCRSPRDTGCAVSYATFRDTAPPPANSYFGRPSQPGWKAACTNPAALRGGTAMLHPYLPTDGVSLPILTLAPPVWATGVTVDTPFVTLPRFVEARCAEKDGFDYLELHVRGNPADPRIDDIGGDLTPEWGLHLADVNVAMGDLVRLVKRQARAWRARHR